MGRQDTLDEAINTVCHSRTDAYGNPENTFTLIADLWSVYTGFPVNAHDVAIMMMLLKIARAKTGKPRFDNYVDMAGYAACAEEIKEAMADGI